MEMSKVNTSPRTQISGIQQLNIFVSLSVVQSLTIEQPSLETCAWKHHPYYEKKFHVCMCSTFKRFLILIHSKVALIFFRERILKLSM